MPLNPERAVLKEAMKALDMQKENIKLLNQTLDDYRHMLAQKDKIIELTERLRQADFHLAYKRSPN